jgi:uncharacterized membrane protein YkvI
VGLKLEYFFFIFFMSIVGSIVGQETNQGLALGAEVGALVGIAMVAILLMAAHAERLLNELFDIG